MPSAMTYLSEEVTTKAMPKMVLWWHVDHTSKKELLLNTALSPMQRIELLEMLDEWRRYKTWGQAG